MRIAAGEHRRIEPDLAQELMRLLARGGRRNAIDLRPERDRVFDRQPRIERGVAVLEHHLHAAAQFPQRQGRTDRLAVEQDFPVIRLDQSDDQARGRGLAAAGFADNADHLALVDRERDVVDRPHDALRAEKPAAQAEMLDEILHLQERLRRAADIGAPVRAFQLLTSIALRKPSLRRLKQIETMKIIAPGNAATHGLT